MLKTQWKSILNGVHLWIIIKSSSWTFTLFWSFYWQSLKHVWISSEIYFPYYVGPLFLKSSSPFKRYLPLWILKQFWEFMWRKVVPSFGSSSLLMISLLPKYIQKHSKLSSLFLLIFSPHGWISFRQVFMRYPDGNSEMNCFILGG